MELRQIIGWTIVAGFLLAVAITPPHQSDRAVSVPDTPQPPVVQNAAPGPRLSGSSTISKSSQNAVVSPAHEKCRNEAALWYAILVAGIEPDRSPPRIIIKESEWRALKWQDKTAIARLFSCAIAGPEMTISGMEYIGDRSMQVLAVWTGTKLRTP